MDAPSDGDLDSPPLAPSREEMLEAIPLHVTIWTDVDLDEQDPSLSPDGRRRCIAERRAGGRCTAAAPHGALLCNAHSGRLDPSAGGKARAERLRDAAETQQERDRLSRLGPRGVIRETFASEAVKLRQTIRVLLDAASQGDLAAAKLLGPYLNQGFGMPAETVTVDSTVPALEEIRSLPTAELTARLQVLRGGVQDETAAPVDADAASSETG